MNIFKRIVNNLKYRLKLFNSAPEYIENKYIYGLRAALNPYIKIVIWALTKSGAKIRIGKDKVDEYILKDMYTSYENIYFPDGVSLKQDDVILDVGAHHGLYAIELVARFPGIKVLCIEPDVEACSIINLHVSKNKFQKNINLIPYAIGDEEKEAYLADNDDGSWGKTVELTSNGKTLKIKLKTLSGILGNERNIKLVKSNCEGGEFDLIPQMIKLGIKPNFIILMIHPNRGNTDLLVQSLIDYGYHPRLAWPSSVNPCWHFILNEQL